MLLLLKYCYIKDIDYIDNNNNTHYQRNFMCNSAISYGCFIFVGLRRSNSVPITRWSNIIWFYDLEVRKDGWAISTDSQARKDNRNLLTVRSSIAIEADRLAFALREIAFTHFEPQEKIRDLVFRWSASFRGCLFLSPVYVLPAENERDLISPAHE